MCGLICKLDIRTNAPPVNEAVIDIFEDQQARGTKGFGIINISPDKTFKVDRATEPVKFMLDLRDQSRASQMLIVHHRTPTSSDNKLKQTHPIRVSNDSLKHDYLVVHNGIIYNDAEVKKSHEGIGFTYTTEEDNEWNDSEALAIELARLIEGQTKILQSRGSMAFIAVQISKKTQKASRIYFGRHLNPLNLAKTRGQICLSSEGPGDEIAEDMLYSFKLDSEMKLSKKKFEIKAYVAAETTTVVPAKTYAVPYGEDETDYHDWKGYPQQTSQAKIEACNFSDVPEELENDAEQIYGLLEEFFAICNCEDGTTHNDTAWWADAICNEMEEYRKKAEKLAQDKIIEAETYDHRTLTI